MFPSSSGHRSSNLDGVFLPEELENIGFEVPVQPFVELLEPQFHWDSTLLARDQRFQDLRFLFFAQSNLEFMKEEIFFSPPRMPVAIFDRLRIPGALFHFILLAGGGRTLKLGPQVRRCWNRSLCVTGRSRARKMCRVSIVVEDCRMFLSFFKEIQAKDCWVWWNHCVDCFGVFILYTLYDGNVFLSQRRGTTERSLSPMSWKAG